MRAIRLSVCKCVFSFISTTKVLCMCECVVGGLSVSAVNNFVFFSLYGFPSVLVLVKTFYLF